jgi:5-methyltetrahydropteroyltriglutamate--homocysteine methyltransferase
MKLSSDRILTTHVGSLPRGPAVVDMLMRKDRGESYDRAEFDATMGQAVDELMRRQVATGIDVVSDGETSKISYATYIKDRLSGFGGDNKRLIAQDLQNFPEFRSRMAVFAGVQSFKRAACIGPIEVIERDSLAADLRNLRAAAGKHAPHDVFMNAASPGVVSAFQPNKYYPTHEKYVEAIAEAMREEYETIVGAGFVLQVDCPDLAMARHTGFQTLSEEQFLRRAEHQVEALNEALRNVPASSLRMHLCWGNYEGPHHCDVPLGDIIDIVFQARANGIALEAANPRHAHEWELFETVRLPAGKVLIPGVIESKANFIEHPELISQRIGRYAKLVGRENVMAGSDCGYGTWVGQAAVDPLVVWEKLRAMAEGARLASKKFWG